MEHYEDVSDPKQKLFQKKFKQLMSRGNVIACMNQQMDREKERKEHEEFQTLKRS